MAKSNEQHLRDCINAGNTTEAIEFLDALLEEHNGEIDTWEEDVKGKDEEIEKLQEQIDDVSYETIDFGVGKLEYIQPDNLRVQNFMDGLKQRFHGHTLD